ncbi:MAG: ATP-binding protein [Mariprofundaceae bacterium]|nr:ATP-binding protein [Mariprofundaceae bacterium]
MVLLRRSVGIRLALMLGLFLTLMLGGGYIWLETRGSDFVAEEASRQAEATARSLVTSLNSIMLAGRGSIAHDWLNRISHLPDIELARVYRVDGTEAFQDTETIQQVNGFLGEERFHRQTGGQAAHAPIAIRKPLMSVARGQVAEASIKNGNHFTLMSPIHVENNCMECHGYTNNPIRGVLVLRMSTQQTAAGMAAIEKNMAVIFAGIACLLVVGAGMGTRQLVLKPLKQLNTATEQIYQGDFAYRLSMQRTDEFGMVASKFNMLVARLVDQINREQQLRLQQEGLTRTIFALSRGLVSDKVLYQVGELAKEIIGARYCMVSNKDEEGNKHFIPLGMSEEEEKALTHPPEEGKGLLGLLWDEHRIVRTDDIASHPASAGFPPEHPKMSSFLGAPLMFGDEILGTICLTDKLNGQPFTEEDETTIQTLAAVSAVALSNARHMELLRASNAGLEQRVEERTAALAHSNSRLRSHEVELELMNEELANASEAKNQFLANTSHELRTPLNAIIGFSELLTNPRIGELSGKQLRYVEHVHTSGKRLLNIINDLLDISKIEAGMMTIDESTCTPGVIADQVVNELMPLAGEKSLQLELHKDEGADRDVVVDADKLRHILINLVGNAIKFTPGEGHVDIHMGVKRVDKAMLVTFSVADDGIGIAPKDRERIFEPFVQAKGGLDRERGGTGLGLALTRKQVHMLGGDIRLDSEEGKGAVFTVSIPVRMVDASASKAIQQQETVEATAVVDENMEAIPNEGPQPRILIVDRDRARAVHLKEMMEQECYRVICSDIAHAAVAAQRDIPFLIMLGICAEDDQAYQHLQTLRTQASTRNIPVVLVGGTASEPEFSIGTVDMVEKNMPRQDLLDMISRYGHHASIRPSTPTVLVVDDDASVRAFLKESLVTEGYHILCATNGDDGVRMAIEREPDLIILDLMMPGITGFDVLRRLHQSPGAADIPIIIYTAKDLSREESLHLGREAERVLIKGVAGRAEILRQLQKLELLYPVQAHLVDAQVNCFNQRYFRRRLEQETENSKRYSQRFSLVGWQVDEYDTYIHQHGERWGIAAMKEMIEIVKGTTRNGDVCSRVGMARFILMLPGITPAGAERVAEKLRIRIRHTRFPLPEEPAGKLTASFSVVHFGEDAEEAQALVNQLTQRLDVAVHAGGDQTILLAGEV